MLCTPLPRPSLYRICRTTPLGWRRHRDRREAGIRERFERELGFVAKCYARLIGPALLWTSRRESARRENEFRYEPPPFVERKNWTAGAQPA